MNNNNRFNFYLGIGMVLFELFVMLSGKTTPLSMVVLVGGFILMGLSIIKPGGVNNPGT